LATAEAALQRLQAGHSLSVEALCSLIKSFEMNTSTADDSLTAGEKEASVDPSMLNRYAGYYRRRRALGVSTITPSLVDGNYYLATPAGGYASAGADLTVDVFGQSPAIQSQSVNLITAAILPPFLPAVELSQQYQSRAVGSQCAAVFIRADVSRNGRGGGSGANQCGRHAESCGFRGRDRSDRY
jgi:hypothetical protein